MTDRQQGVEWLVAAVAPWTISPHPNFRERSISPAAHLALITECRALQELDRYEVGALDESKPWEGLLLTAARESLFTMSQPEAVDRLWSVAEDSSVPFGPRVAASLYASVALSELEHPDQAAERIANVYRSVAGNEEPRRLSPEFRLCTAVLLQQRVARLEEASNFHMARAEVEEVLRWVPGPSEKFSESFRVSDGISWGPSRIQRDIAESVRYHALASKASLEQLAGHTWMRVVKGRSPWIDERMTRVATARDSFIVRDAFEKIYDSTSGTRYLMREDPSVKGYAALLISELSGHSGRMRENREAQAKALILEGAADVHQVSEAIRLLRQGRARKSLQSVLRWVRDQGPTSALKTDAGKIIDRALKTQKITETDLSVLDTAADFLDRQDLKRAIKATFYYVETEQLAHRATWAVLDKMWKTLSRLVADSGQDDVLARKAADYLSRDDVLTEPFTSTLTRTLDSIDWTKVSEPTTAIWKNWIDETSLVETAVEREHADITQLRRAVRQRLMGQQEDISRLAGLERAAFLADNGLPGGCDATLLDEVRVELRRMLEEEGAAARSGVISHGGYSTSNVAVAYAFRFPDSRLWNDLGAYLIDADIDGVLKDSALDRIASRPDEVPAAVRRTLQKGWGNILQTKRQDFYMDATPLPVFASALRMGGALNIISQEEALRGVLSLVASNDTARVQAARTIPFVLDQGDPTWGHALLLQLARDSNPDVRAEAGHSLVLALVHSSGLTGTLEEVIVELTDADGIQVPLRILHAFQRLSIERPEIVAKFGNEISILRRPEQPRVVRRAAEAVKLSSEWYLK